MDGLELARVTARAGIDEVVGNLKIRKAFNTFFVANSAVLYDRGAIGGLNKELGAMLALNQIDSAPVYRGLYVELHGIFERFVGAFATECVDRIARRAKNYSALDPVFRKQHSAHAAKILSHIAAGDINGIKYDFDDLLKRLGVCFSDSKPPPLVGNVFTVQMGNCTPKRLEDLFGILGLGDPFDDELGKQAAIKALPGNSTGARAAAKRANDLLKEAIKTRNRVVHDHDSLPQVSDSDLDELAQLISALIEAFDARARVKYPEIL